MKGKNLSQKERLYHNMMKANSGVLYIKGKPGFAKSSIARSIADKMGFQYIDVRLSMVDETDIGLFPYLSDEGNSQKTVNYAIPKWALQANEKPTILHFEELNRASLAIRNAALGILMERTIGEFKFNSNVYMMASGNMGEDDNCEVEEFDGALNNRLIHIDHYITIDEWVTEFAQGRVHQTVIDFIKANPGEFDKVGNDSNAYASPRSWTFLSDYIATNFGMESNSKEWLKEVQQIGNGYVGKSILPFVRYCETQNFISINDVINAYPQNKKNIEKLNRDKKSELLGQLKKVKIDKLKKDELENVMLFLEDISPDERVGFLIDFTIEADLTDKNIESLLIRFKSDLSRMKDKLN